MSDPIQTIAKQLGIQTFGDGLLVKIRETIDLLRDEAYDCKQYREVVTQQVQEIAVLKANVVTDNSMVLVNALAELERLKVQPRGVVQWPDADEIMQMAFEEGQPGEDASGYYFELEEFDLFIQRLMEEVARLNSSPVSAGDETIRYWFIGDVGQEAGKRRCKKSSLDGSLALFESESDAKRAVRRHPGTEVYMVEYYRKPQALSALSANHSEQVREVVPDLANLKADSARYQFLKENCQQDVDGYRNETPVLVHALSHVSDWRGRIDESIDAAISASPSAGSQKEQGE